MSSFFYFAYGSNLLARRLQKSCPSAKLYGLARLDNHSLTFWNLADGPSGRWKGAVATIAPKSGDHLWGAVWEIHETELVNLDKQEGIHTGIYRRYPVVARMASGETREFISYAMVEHTPEQCTGIPSPHYLRVIREGAELCGMPAEYQNRLCAIADNGFSGDVPGMTGLQ